MPGCAEHQRLIDVPKSVDLGLGGFEPHLKLFLNSLEVAEVAGSPVEQGYFAGLLVRRRESLLEACVTVPEFVSPALLRLDALFANGLAARIGASRVVGRQVLFIVFIAVVVAAAAPSLMSTSYAGPCSRTSEGGETMGTGNGCSVRKGGGRRVGATAAAASARRGHAIRREFTTADVGEGGTGDADTIGGSVGANGRSSAERGRRVGVVADGARQAEAIRTREADGNTESGRLRVRLEIVETVVHVGEGGVHGIHEVGALGVFKIHCKSVCGWCSRLAGIQTS